MTTLLLLLACGTPQAVAPAHGEAPQPTAPTLAPTLPDPTGGGDPFDGPVRINPTALTAATTRLVFLGQAALCEGDEAWVTAEFLGEADQLTATAWRDGAARVTLEVPLDELGPDPVFHMADTQGTVAGCDTATWVWELTAEGREPACVVTGPDAASVLPLAPEGCGIR